MTGTVSCGPGARWWLLTAATGILVGALSGCSGSQDVAHPTSASASPTLQSSAPTTSESTSSPSPALPTTSVGPSASVAARHTPGCTARQLEISFAYSGAGLGNWAAILRYKNIGGATCSLRGSPKVTAFDTVGRVAALGRPELNGYLGGATSIQTINVPPDAYASSRIQGGDNPVGSATTCPDYPVLQVAAPNTRTYVRLQLSGSLSGSVPGTLSGCAGLSVNPVVAGQTGGAL
jgi:Protein of unknown function (DUF4232)